MGVREMSPEELTSESEAEARGGQGIFDLLGGEATLELREQAVANPRRPGLGRAHRREARRSVPSR